MRNHSFQWVGRDRTGVSKWSGNREALRLGTAVLGTLGATGLIGGALLAAFVHQPTGLLVMGCMGLLHTGLAWWMHCLHDRLSRLTTVEEVAETTGINSEVLQRCAYEQRAAPRAMINDQYLYEPSVFGEAATLLRASDGPDQNLLRPAASATVDDETLLHTVADERTQPALRAENADHQEASLNFQALR